MSAKVSDSSGPKRLKGAALVLGFSVFLVSGFLVSAVQGRVSPSMSSHGLGEHPIARGVPPSVTSIGAGGRRVNGVPPSVTSSGVQGPNRTFRERPNSENRRHHRDEQFIPWGGAIYGVPYDPYDSYDSYDDASQAPADDTTDSGQQAGPTIFDRRGLGTSRTADQSSADSSPATQHAPQPAVVPNQPDTVLVFKDGHHQEVTNYAIVGSTLFDLTGGRSRKIPLSELDLMATAKQNDDRGIDFQVPVGTEGN